MVLIIFINSNIQNRGLDFDIHLHLVLSVVNRFIGISRSHLLMRKRLPVTGMMF